MNDLVIDTVRKLESDTIRNPNPNSENDTGWVLPEEFRELADNGGTRLIIELIEAFEADTAPGLGQLREAIAAADIGRLRSAAHSLKGSALQMAADAMASLCQELELAPMDTPVVELMRLLTALEAESAKVYRAMSLWR